MRVNAIGNSTTRRTEELQAYSWGGLTSHWHTNESTFTCWSLCLSTITSVTGSLCVELFVLYDVHLSSSTDSLKLYHFVLLPQMVQTNKFRMYDYGSPSKNMEHYGQVNLQCSRHQIVPSFQIIPASIHLIQFFLVGFTEEGCSISLLSLR